MNIVEMLKEGRMDAKSFLAIGEDQIGIRGMIRTDSSNQMGIVEIIAWTVTRPGTPVGVYYRRQVRLKDGAPYGGPTIPNYEIAVHLDMGDVEIGKFLEGINGQAHPACTTTVPVSFVRYWKSAPVVVPAKWAFTHSDPQFVLHLTALHCFCWMKHDSPDFVRKVTLSQFNVRLQAYLHNCYGQMSAALMGEVF